MNNDVFYLMTAGNYVRHLLDETDENNMLCIPGWYYDGNYESDIFYSCEIEWTEEEREQFIAEFEEFLAKTSDIAKKLTRVHICDVKEALSEEEFAFWDKYLRPFEENVWIGDFDDANSISSKTFFGEELSEEEKKIYKAYKADIYKQAEERLGKNEYSYDVISRAARLCKLISLNAPEIVVGKERNTLIAAMLMYRFGKSLTKIQGVTSEGE